MADKVVVDPGGATASSSWMFESQASTSPMRSEILLLQIAKDLPNEKWKPLGRALGLSKTDLDSIVADPQLHSLTELQCYQMLLLWHSQAEPMWEKLAEALHSEEVECPHLARRYLTSEVKPENESPEVASNQLKHSSTGADQSSSLEEKPGKGTSQRDNLDQPMIQMKDDEDELGFSTPASDLNTDTDTPSPNHTRPKSQNAVLRSPVTRSVSHDTEDVHEPEEERDHEGQQNQGDESQVGQPPDTEQQQVTCPKSYSSPRAPSHHSQESQTGGQDTDPQRQEEKPILYLWNFSAYSCVRRFCFHTTLVAVVLTTLMLMQIFLVSIDCYESYNIRSEHSQCSCSFPYPWFVPTALRIASRFAFPLVLSIVFWRQVVCRKGIAAESQPGPTGGTFAAEIEQDNNNQAVKYLVENVVRSIWDPSVKSTDNGKKLLKKVRDRMDTELKWMCITSLVQSVILVASFFAFNLVDAHNTHWFKSSVLLGVADTLSFGIVTAVSGVMLSFYFIESKIKRYVRAVHTLPHSSLPSDSPLRKKAKRTEHCITNRWYPLEIGIRFASVIIPVILLMNWTSDIPLSCGFSVSKEAITKYSPSAAACWLSFIVVVTFGQVMVTSPFNPIYIRLTGLGMEVAMLIVFYITFPNNEWMQLTHVLYAIVPLSYLIWYHIASIRRQWLAINMTDDGNPTYVSRLASRTALLIFILATLVASLYVEYGHIHPSAIDKYNSSCINA